MLLALDVSIWSLDVQHVLSALSVLNAVQLWTFDELTLLICT